MITNKKEKQISFQELIKKLNLEAVDLKNFTLTNRQFCDLELLLNGAFRPLKSFMNQMDYQNVLNSMRLKNGKLWPIPIMLDANKDYIKKNNIKKNSKIALRDKEGFLIAIMTIEDVWKIDKKQEARAIYGTTNDELDFILLYP